MPQQLLDHLPWRNPANLKTLSKAGLIQFLGHFVTSESDRETSNQTDCFLRNSLPPGLQLKETCLSAYMHMQTRVCRHIPACTAVCTHAHDHSPCPSQFSFWDRAKLQYGGVLITGAGSLCFCHVLKSNSARKPSTARGRQTHLEKVLWSCIRTNSINTFRNWDEPVCVNYKTDLQQRLRIMPVILNLDQIWKGLFC